MAATPGPCCLDCWMSRPTTRLLISARSPRSWLIRMTAAPSGSAPHWHVTDRPASTVAGVRPQMPRPWASTSRPTAVTRSHWSSLCPRTPTRPRPALTGSPAACGALSSIPTIPLRSMPPSRVTASTATATPWMPLVGIRCTPRSSVRTAPKACPRTPSVPSPTSVWGPRTAGRRPACTLATPATTTASRRSTVLMP